MSTARSHEARVRTSSVGVVERVQEGDVAGGGHMKDRAVTEGAAVCCRSVKTPSGSLDETADWLATIGDGVGERVENRECAAGSHVEDCAVPRHATVKRHSIEVSIGGLD